MGNRRKVSPSPFVEEGGFVAVTSLSSLPSLLPFPLQNRVTASQIDLRLFSRLMFSDDRLRDDDSREGRRRRCRRRKKPSSRPTAGHALSVGRFSTFRAFLASKYISK